MRVLRILAVAALLCSGAFSRTSIIVGNKGTGATAASTTLYWLIAAGNVGSASTASSSNEGHVIMPIAIAGTFCSLQGYASTNGATTNSTLTFRKGSGTFGTPSMADGSGVATFTAATTGASSIASSCDHVNAGDFISLKFTSGSGGTVAVPWWSMVFTPDDPTLTWMKFGAYQGGGSTAATSSATTYYETLSGIFSGTSATAESLQQFKTLVAGTWKNSCFTISANSFTADGSITSRINGSNGSQTGTITQNTGSTLTQLCLSGTDTIAANDLVNYALIPATSTSGSLTVQSQASDFVTTNGMQPFVSQNGTGGQGFAQGTTRWLPPYGSIIIATSQGLYAERASQTYTITALQANVSFSAASTDTTYEIWKNNASTGMTITITAGTTGYVAATGGPVTFGPSDTMEIKVIIGSGSGNPITINHFTMAVTLAGAVRHRVL